MLNLQNIPAELAWLDQWCVAGPDDSGNIKAPYTMKNGAFVRADVNKIDELMSFDHANSYSKHYNDAPIGLILSENDPFVVIDMDVTDADSQAKKGQPIDSRKWTTKEQLDRYWSIVEAFSSYTEVSISGKGLHLIVKGKLDKGYRRDGVEVYPHGRFIICTGNMVVNKPIAERQSLLDTLVKEMESVGVNRIELEELPETEHDSSIWDKAMKASNSEKFIRLCEGKWSEMGFPSQSEADMALMSMFAFYSNSNAQCKRMFRQTNLGVREKATVNDKYLNFTLQLIRGKQKLNQEVQSEGEKQADEVLKNIIARAKGILSPSIAVATMNPLPVDDMGKIDWPPGLIGQIAAFIYKSAPRPVKEVAIVGALGFMAGICGKAYNVNRSGLNMYIILVAKSAVGKEAMHSGVSSLLASVVGKVPQASQFVDFTAHVSGQALMKAVAENPCFVNIFGEFGKTLIRMSREGAIDPAMEQLRTAMTNLFQKSGPTSVVGGMSYSDKTKNTKSVKGVAYSMIGETTPSSLYESLTDSMMADGFLSRFITIQYHGDRPDRNYQTQHEPDKALSDAVASIAHHTLLLMQRHAVHNVNRTDEAGLYFYNFELECDKRIRSTSDEAYRQMWNRASLKAEKLAALLAVCDHYIDPIITTEHAEWAVNLIRLDISTFEKKLNAGDIGLDDHSRERKMVQVMQDCIVYGIEERFKVPLGMVQEGIIPLSVVKQKLLKIPQFSKQRCGGARAIDLTLQSLINSGNIQEVEKSILIRKYAFLGKCYRLLNAIL